MQVGLPQERGLRVGGGGQGEGQGRIGVTQYDMDEWSKEHAIARSVDVCKGTL